MNRKWRAFSSVVALILIVIAFAASHGVLFRQNISQTHWEDTLFFEHTVTHVQTMPDCFTRESVWPGLYRPLSTNCYYYLGHILFNNQIEFYHIINAVMICLNGWLLFLLSRELFHYNKLSADLLALIPGLLFITRKSHAEVVLNTVEFQALLYAFWGLLALLLVARQSKVVRWPSLIGAGLALFFGLLSKEAAVSVIGIWLLSALLWHRPCRWITLAVPILIGVTWIFLFIGPFRGLSQHEPTGFTYLATVDNILNNYGAYFFSFFNRVTSADENIVMSARAIELGSSLFGKSTILFFGAVSFTLIVMDVVKRKMWPVSGRENTDRIGQNADSVYYQMALHVSFGIAFFFLATAPFVLFEERLFARYGYFGHAGIALSIGSLAAGIAYGLQRLFDLRAMAKVVHARNYRRGH